MVIEEQTQSKRPGFIGYPLFFVFVGWVFWGQLVLLFLRFDYESVGFAVDFVSSFIPSVESLRAEGPPKVFDSAIAIGHHSIMWLLSPIPVGVVIFYPVQDGEKIFFIKNPSRAMSLSVALFGLAVISACLDFYTGVFTFGLASTPYGFAFLSSVESFFFVVAARYMKLSFN